MLINRLIPCNHLECNSCFIGYHQKLGKQNCPVCCKPIEKYTILNGMTLTDSNALTLETAGTLIEETTTTEAIYESFDHQYFETEIANLVHLRDTVENERFFSRRLLDAHSASRHHEW